MSCELSAENQTTAAASSTAELALQRHLSLNLEVINRLAGQQASGTPPSLSLLQVPCQAFYVDTGPQALLFQVPESSQNLLLGEEGRVV